MSHNRAEVYSVRDSLVEDIAKVSKLINEDCLQDAINLIAALHKALPYAADVLARELFMRDIEGRLANLEARLDKTEES